MKIGILGAGNVGGALGSAWARKGHEVFFGVPRPQDTKTQELLKTIGAKCRAGSVAEAAAASDVIVLATPWPAAQDAIRAAGNLEGKMVVDCTNPLKADFTGLVLGYTTSGVEQVAQWAKGAKVFKAFNQTGFNIMSNPEFAGQRAVMFVCGDDDAHKPTVLKLVKGVGFEAIDAGGLVIARLLEPYAMLWIYLANARGLGRDFAFGILRRDK
ncbi:MAG TPA: NADPH-dependent F420 reductase [Candidatus Binataceae bacterium]|jgi:predicted dinucleotide-binding enzyme|nr:NADPH-dependent F420 reductase [Candidatus Binataceae bacterium]